MMDSLKFIVNLNLQAHEMGYANGFEAYLAKSGSSLEEYSAIFDSFENDLEGYKLTNPPKKRKRFLASVQDCAKILAVCGVNIEGLDIRFEEGLRQPFTDTAKKCAFIGVWNGKVDLKSVAHEAGHLRQLKKRKKIMPIHSERLAIEYELKLMRKLCEQSNADFASYALDRFYIPLVQSAVKKVLFETEKPAQAAAKYIELRERMDVLKRWRGSLDVVSEDFRDVNLIYGIGAALGFCE